MHDQSGEEEELQVLVDWDQVSNIISDDSSFYGNDEERAELSLKSRRLSRYHKAKLWIHQQASINSIALKERGHQNSLILKNPYEGHLAARQLNESVEEFLSRVPVLRNPYSDWLWIANFKAGGQIFDEDSRKLEPEFFSRGLRLLNVYSDKKLRFQSQNIPPAQIASKLATERIELKGDILRTATECRVVVGKWLLFPLEKDCPVVWEKVCYGVGDGRLGIGAKIAANSDGGSQRIRVICIYTKNFNDREDVKRVVEEIQRLDLLPRDEKKSIYYKCDAYTALNIMSGNDYGLSASLYASHDFLPKPKKESGANILTMFDRDVSMED